MSHSPFDEITDAVKEIVLQIDADTQILPKYGGEVFAPDPDTPKAIVGGVFAYKDHVSVEFSEGASFDDPHGHLEGGGKARRHVKLRSLEDVEAKTVRAFLEQAFER
ncbi:DUF1801 domain-containing protein [Cognatishimia sp. MH4019]|uniref:DUF1801 domain-containing protein n=1 Tax=Cognatishimia sp. MH4019 TaxID=2854030 RepID=UPI001CD39757|nr:DUF1801 domain-containing protein [Cognatishimia sp. MH4019]